MGDLHGMTIGLDAAPLSQLLGVPDGRSVHEATTPGRLQISTRARKREKAIQRRSLT